MKNFKWIAATFCLLFSAQSFSQIISAANAAGLYGDQTTYSIYRKGKKIGVHSLKINADAERIDVSVDSTITISVLKIPVFKFNYVADEVWQDGQLLSVDATTTTNKEVETAKLDNSSGSSVMTSNGTSDQVPLIAYATNHWNESAVEQSTLFNTVKGIQSKVSVEKISNEPLQLGETTLLTTHYKYTGDLIVESWYDERNRWVKLAFLGSDGSQITYIIDNP